MSLIKFEIGDQVMAIENNTVREGVIMNFFPDVNPPMLIVKFEDGEVEKVPLTAVALKPKIETSNEQSIERVCKPVEVSETMIDSAKFQEIAIKTIIEESDDDITLMLTFGIFVDKLRKALFGTNDEV